MLRSAQSTSDKCTRHTLRSDPVDPGPSDPVEHPEVRKFNSNNNIDQVPYSITASYLRIYSTISKPKLVSLPCFRL